MPDENGLPEKKKGFYIDLSSITKIAGVLLALGGTTGVNQFLTGQKVDASNDQLIQSLALKIANDEELMDYIYFKVHQREDAHPQPAATRGHEEALREPINAMTSPLFEATPNQPIEAWSDVIGPQLPDSTKSRLEEQAFINKF